MVVYITDFSAPSEVHLRSGEEIGGVHVELVPFSGTATINDLQNGEQIDDDSELWMWLIQDGHFEKVGEVDLDTEWWIEEWDGSSIEVTLYAQDPEDTVVDSDWFDCNFGLVPGPAEIGISGRGSDEPVLFRQPAEIIADFTTIDDVEVLDVTPVAFENGVIETDFTVGSPIPVGSRADIRVDATRLDTGEVFDQFTLTDVSISGTLDYGTMNENDFTTEVQVPGGLSATVEVCCEIVDIRRC